jgi:hypothetical protein
MPKYRYVYQYWKDMDTRIQQFFKKKVRRYILLVKNKKRITHIKIDKTITHCNLLKYLSSIITEQHVSCLKFSNIGK